MHEAGPAFPPGSGEPPGIGYRKNRNVSRTYRGTRTSSDQPR